MAEPCADPVAEPYLPERNGNEPVIVTGLAKLVLIVSKAIVSKALFLPLPPPPQ